MSRVLIFGGAGMLGHKLVQTLDADFDVYAAVRGDGNLLTELRLIDEKRLIKGVSVSDFDAVVNAVAHLKPTIIINAVGIVKQVSGIEDAETAIEINSLFPHRLARVAAGVGARMITFSTDCIFSGKRGMYAETDMPDAEDLYGRSKLLGEISGEGLLTIRTSIIGRQLRSQYGLIEWFLSQSGKSIKGYTKARFSGFPTISLAEIVRTIITEHPSLSGVWHVAAQPVDKFTLLEIAKHVTGLKVEITPDDSYVCDRTLNGARFQSRTAIVPPSWQELIERMFADPTPYEELRKVYAN